MQQANKYQLIGRKYFQKVADMYGLENVHVSEQRGKSSESGTYEDGSVYMRVPNPTTPDKLYSFLHEVAHLLLKHNDPRRNEPQNVDEVEAERWAMRTMEREGIPLSAHVRKMVQVDMATIIQDLRDGEEIDRRAVEMAGPWLERGGAYGPNAWKKVADRL